MERPIPWAPPSPPRGPSPGSPSPGRAAPLQTSKEEEGVLCKAPTVRDHSAPALRHGFCLGTNPREAPCQTRSQTENHSRGTFPIFCSWAAVAEVPPRARFPSGLAPPPTRAWQRAGGRPEGARAAATISPKLRQAADSGSVPLRWNSQSSRCKLFQR
ncbi:uncharacterized protein ACOB8E_013332 [Sarcophilus harrisii]